MARSTSETLLLSAIINTGDAALAKTYGILPQHFHGYRHEYEWVLSYRDRYGSCPSRSAMLTAFPEFPFSNDEQEARWPAEDVRRAYSSREMTRAITLSMHDLTRGEVETAYSRFDGLVLETVSERPVSLLDDPEFLDDYHQTAEKRMPMPWKTLQQTTYGQGPGELWYVAARQGHGKTSDMIYMAAESAMAGYNVQFYSLEMTKRQIQVRLHAILGNKLGRKVNATKMLHRQFDSLDYKHLLAEISEKVPGTIDVHVPSMGRVTPSVVASRANDYDQTFIDYAGLMYTDTGVPAISDYRSMAQISNELKEIALAKDTRIVAAAQVNREGDNSDWPPKLKHLAQSDHLGNDGDVVLTMRRYTIGSSVFSIEKNRHGPSGVNFWTIYDANNGDFHEVTREKAELTRSDDE